MSCQVDERVAAGGHTDWNVTHLRESPLPHAPLPPEQIYAMPAELTGLKAAAACYAKTLQEIAGTPSLAFSFRGHADIKTTMRYAHTNREAQTKAVGRLGGSSDKTVTLADSGQKDKKSA